MKCANCQNDSFYVYSVTRTKKIYYCHSCLPKFLVKQRDAGFLETTDTFKEALAYSETAVPEEVVEEPVELLATVKKKTAKKTAK